MSRASTMSRASAISRASDMPEHLRVERANRLRKRNTQRLQRRSSVHCICSDGSIFRPGRTGREGTGALRFAAEQCSLTVTKVTELPEIPEPTGEGKEARKARERRERIARERALAVMQERSNGEAVLSGEEYTVIGDREPANLRMRHSEIFQLLPGQNRGALCG